MMSLFFIFVSSRVRVCVYLYSKMVECCHSHMPLTYSNYNLHQPFDWSSVRVYNN